MRRVVLEERKRVRREIDEEKVCLSLFPPPIQTTYPIPPKRTQANTPPPGRQTNPPLLLGPLPHPLYPLHPHQTPKTTPALPCLLPQRHPSAIPQNPRHGHFLNWQNRRDFYIYIHGRTHPNLSRVRQDSEQHPQGSDDGAMWPRAM